MATVACEIHDTIGCVSSAFAIVIKPNAATIAGSIADKMRHRHALPVYAFPDASLLVLLVVFAAACDICVISMVPNKRTGIYCVACR